MRVEQLREIIENKIEERKQLYQDATSTGSLIGGERVQTSGTAGKMTGIIEKYVELDRQINKHMDEMMEIIHTIELLGHDEYDVLHKKYVQGMTLRDVARKREKAYSTTAHTHSRALRHLQEILDIREGKTDACMTESIKTGIYAGNADTGQRNIGDVIVSQ